MPKKPVPIFPKNGVKMRNGQLADGTEQDLYFSNEHPEMPGWFKGMEILVKERGLWQDGLLAQCEGFKCKAGTTDCCCRRILFSQSDFVNQKSALEELIESRGHICDFYPKFHCELNFIEQYWGAVKRLYRVSPRTADINEMERNAIACLDSISRIQINWYVSCCCKKLLADQTPGLPIGQHGLWMHM
jgi:hypothetical protein